MAAKSLATRIQEAELAKLEAERDSYLVTLRKETAEAIGHERENAFYKNLPAARGEFHLLDAVDDEVVHELIYKMDTWKQKHPGEPITLYIDSPGGIVMSGLALCDYIDILRSEGHHITTVGLGLIASMAGVIHQMGDTRKLTKRSWLMIHEVQGVAMGSLTEQKDEIRLNERLQDQCLEILAAKSSMNKVAIKKRWVRKDWWLDAEEARKGGFVDDIV